MGIGLFDRQTPIGLSVPEWLTLYWTADSSSLEESQKMRDVTEEIVEGAAVMGCRGVTLILAYQGTVRSIHPGGIVLDIVEKIEAYRPYFSMVLCDSTYYRQHEGSLSVGRTLILRHPQERHALILPAELPPSLLKDWAVVIDFPTSLVGKTTDPIGLVTEVHGTGEVDFPCEIGQWCDEADATNLQSTEILLALNMLAKPERFENNTFLFAADFLDEVVAQAFNERRLRPRWELVT
jgi:hypothetical protein